jgi:hypothetical protein
MNRLKEWIDNEGDKVLSGMAISVGIAYILIGLLAPRIIKIVALIWVIIP